jgi:hypothetical protein
MEAAAIFIISAIHRKRAGGVMLMAELPESMPDSPEEVQELMALFDVDRAICVAVEGVKRLIQQDQQNVA